MNKHRIDYEIKSRQIKLIQEDEENIFISFPEAIKKAKEQKKNLMELSYKDGISICKIIDYKKHMYQLQKKKKLEQKKSQTMNTIKTLSFKTHIGAHDLEIKIKNARKFLTQNKQVKLILQLLRKDMSKPENIAKGLNILQESINNLSDISKVRIEGRIKKQKDQYVILAPLK